MLRKLERRHSILARDEERVGSGGAKILDDDRRRNVVLAVDDVSAAVGSADKSEKSQKAPDDK